MAPKSASNATYKEKPVKENYFRVSQTLGVSFKTGIPYMKIAIWSLFQPLPGVPPRMAPKSALNATFQRENGEGKLLQDFPDM